MNWEEVEPLFNAKNQKVAVTKYKIVKAMKLNSKIWKEVQEIEIQSRTNPTKNWIVHFYAKNL